ncbi:MAG: nucleoside deaminase [Microbacteriaceae bacterium]|jgi:tRNA(adenine34) deaminase|nr:nucleoside deaminase [Microbacteriaceae bacterium]
MEDSRADEDQRFMREALAEADLAAAAGEVPVGAVAVRDGVIIARGRNVRERSQDPTAHAELIALRAAAHRLGTFRLSDVTIYVTLEPCPMCAGALVNARVGRVVWGCDDPKAGATKTLYNIGADPRLNHRFEMTSGVLEHECAARLSSFFEALRKKPRGRASRP